MPIPLFSHYRPRAGDDPCVPHGCDPSMTPPNTTSKESSPNVQFAFFGLGIILVFLAISLASWSLYRRQRNRHIFPCYPLGPRSTSNRTPTKSIHQSGDIEIVVGLNSPVSPVTPIKVDADHSPAPHEDTKWSAVKNKLAPDSDDEPQSPVVIPAAHMDGTHSRELHLPPSPV